MSAFCAWWRARAGSGSRRPPKAIVRAVRRRSSTSTGADAADVEVVAQVRLELGDVRHDRGAAGGQRRESSAFARATPSTEPTSSRCTGPIAVITPTSGRAIRAQLGDLAEAAHAQLDDADLRVGLEPARA